MKAPGGEGPPGGDTRGTGGQRTEGGAGPPGGRPTSCMGQRIRPGYAPSGTSLSQASSATRGTRRRTVLE